MSLNSSNNSHSTHTRDYNVHPALTPPEASHFLAHGWVLIPNAINPQYIDQWMKEMWIRTGLSPTDKSTWTQEYLHLAHHHQIRWEEFCPAAWGKIVDICGGEEKIHEERERWIGDSLIINFGSEQRSKSSPEKAKQPREKGFHCDNDWYRWFLDSSETALTVICCFTDIPENGGGTWLCEDGIKGVCEALYNHPEGFDPVISTAPMFAHIKDCSVFTPVQAKKGDILLTHGLLPHTVGYNFLNYPRTISNPHVTLREPYDLNREDGNYTLLEQVILRSLSRTSISDYHPTRSRKHWYARNIVFKQNRVPQELERLQKHAAETGEEVDSIYLKGERSIADFRRTNGLDLPMNEEAGVELVQHDIG